MSHPYQDVNASMNSSRSNRKRLLPRPHSAEQAAASLAAVLARRARGCAELHLRIRNRFPAEDELPLWRELLRACTSARTLHVRVGEQVYFDFDDELGAFERRKARALAEALPR